MSLVKESARYKLNDNSLNELELDIGGRDGMTNEGDRSHTAMD
jgi:hypothetical protein